MKFQIKTFIYNSLNKSIISNQQIIVYDLNGSIVLESKNKLSDLSNLKSWHLYNKIIK